jgi:O-antigen/teichoic acid export membrane protein
MIVANVNPVVIKAFWDAAQVGYYTSVLGFGLVIDRVASAVTVPFLPKASSDVAKGNPEEVRRRVSVIERYMLTVLMPVGVIFIFFSADIVTVALGAEFAPAMPVLVCLVINSALTAVFQPYRVVLYAIERQSDLVLSSAVGLAVLLLADALLVPSRLGTLSLPGLGGTGAAIAMVVMTLSSGVIQVRTASQHAGTGFYWKAVLHLLAGLAMYAAMILLGSVISASLWLRLPLLTLVGLAVYLGVLVPLRQFTCNDVQVFLNMLHPQRMLEYISTELDSGR